MGEIAKSANRQISKWGPAIAWMILIFILSAQSQLPAPEQRWLDFLFEKSAHTFEFAVLGALALRALAAESFVSRRSFVVAVILAWLYALSDEFHQSFVPGRAADWTDLIFDWLGAVVGARLWLRWWTARRGKKV